MAKQYKNAAVFAVHKRGTLTKYHNVYYSTTGHLNRAPVKKFLKWSLAKKFANAKAKEWGVKATFSQD